MSIRSMTGYARLRRATEIGEAAINLKSVNHRGLDLHFHMPGELDPYENALRTALRKRISRGHVEVRVSFHRVAAAPEVALNHTALDAYVRAFSEAALRHGVDAPVDLNQALRAPGVLSTDVDQEPDAGIEKTLVALMDEAIDELNRFRDREGAETAAVLLERTSSIRAGVARVREIRVTALPAFQQRLRERLSELLNGAGIEPQRLVQEAALLADRSDIGEEIARLEIHAGQLDQILAQGGEVGKKLDFLLQEMNRETNTMLSKTNGTGDTGLLLTEIALGMKADIEKIREQSLNLE